MCDWLTDRVETDEDGSNDDNVIGPLFCADVATDGEIGTIVDWVELICHSGDSGFCKKTKHYSKLRYKHSLCSGINLSFSFCFKSSQFPNGTNNRNLNIF